LTQLKDLKMTVNYRTTLRIAPPGHRVKALRDDYAKMQQMFFGEPPEFDNIIARLQQWEREFNQE
jgi:hypothetical protein